LQFQSIFIPTQKVLLEIPRGRGTPKANILKESMNKPRICRGKGGVQTKKPSMGGVWILSGTTNCKNCIFNLFLIGL